MLPRPLEHYEDLQREAEEHLQHLARSFPENMAETILGGGGVDQRTSLVVRLKDAVGQFLEDKKRVTEPPPRFEDWLRDQRIPNNAGESEALARSAFKQGMLVKFFEREVFAMTLWEIYGTLGFDQDGDPSPESFIVGAGVIRFAGRMVEAAKEHVKDHQEEVSELETALGGATKVTRLGNVVEVTFSDGRILSVIGDQASWSDQAGSGQL